MTTSNYYMGTWVEICGPAQVHYNLIRSTPDINKIYTNPYSYMFEISLGLTTTYVHIFVAFSYYKLSSKNYIFYMLCMAP